ncbi:uncharacterized protein DEA37_0005430, partial [Paragonimus westermani]
MMDHSRILIEEALKETGWQSNFAFPMASEENKYLINLVSEAVPHLSYTLSEVKVKTRLLDEESIEYREKNAKLRTHMALIQHERAITEAVLLERQRECDALRNQMYLAEREIGRTQQDLRQLKAKRKDVKERIGSLENEIFVRSNELSSIKSQMDYDQNLIDVYLDACEEDVRLRERLAAVQHVDDSRFATLNSEAGRLSDKRREVRQKLDTVVSKSDAIRLRVGAASDRCREENQARRDLLHVWETCVNQMIKRDEEHTMLDKEYDEMLEKIKAQTKRVEETKKIALLVEEDIKNSEKSITESNKEIWDARCQLQKVNEDLNATQDELQSLQRTLERTDNDFRSTMAQTKVVKQTIQDLRTNLGQILDKIDTTEKIYQRVRNKRLSVEQLTKMAEEQLLTNEKCQKQAITYQQQLKAISFKKIDDLIKLDEMIYKALLYSQRLEQRIAKLEVDPLLSHDAITVKNQQIKSLQSELDARTKTCLSLSGMINQFRVKRMETRLNQLRNQVMSEEARQLQLDALEHEMEAELNARKNCLQVELRQMGARMVETKAELTSRQRRLDQIRARYNVTVTVNVAANEDALGARMRYLLETLQKRQDLKHKGDTLDAQVRQAEEELRALENTVIVMTALNEEARGKLKLVRSSHLYPFYWLISSKFSNIPLRKPYKNISRTSGRRTVDDRKTKDAKETHGYTRQNNNTTRKPKKVERKHSELRYSQLCWFFEDRCVSFKDKTNTPVQFDEHCEMQLEELNRLMEIVKQRIQTAGLHMEKATRTVEDSKQRYVRAERMLIQVLERLNRFFRTNQSDIKARMLKHFNRLAYMFYEKCLKTSSVPAEELLAVEWQIAESLNFHKPSVLNFRLSQRPVSAKR